MRYNAKFKTIVLKDFITCPYYKSICHKYGINRETIKTWVRKANLDVEELVEQAKLAQIISISKFKTIKVVNLEGLKGND